MIWDWKYIVIISIIVYFMFFNKKENWGLPPNPVTYSIGEAKLHEHVLKPDGSCYTKPDGSCIYADDLGVMQPSAYSVYF